MVVRCFNKWRVEIEHVVHHKMEDTLDSAEQAIHQLQARGVVTTITRPAFESVEGVQDSACLYQHSP